MRAHSGSLWGHPDFLRLWAGQTVSLFGSQVTLLALPLAAALTLDASPFEMGVLLAVEMAPPLLIGLFAGVWVDRRRRRPILIATDIARAAALLVVPVAAWVGALRMEVLYGAALAVGVLSVFFDLAYLAYLPSLVRRDQLVEGNSKLHVSGGFAEVAGPGLAGGLVGLVGAPVAILVDSLSFVASALFVGSIRTRESPPAPTGQRAGVRADIGEGLRLVFGSPLLRVLAGTNGTWSLFNNVRVAVLVLYLTGELGLGPGLVGLVFAGGNVGYLLAALVAGRLPRRFGLGTTLVGAAVVGVAGGAVVAMADGPVGLAAPALAAGLFLSAFGGMIFDINQLSLRQAITPDRLQGRMNASMRIVIRGGAPIGALLGGILGEALGLRPALVVAAIGEALIVPWLLVSPVRRLRETPALVDPTVALVGERP